MASSIGSVNDNQRTSVSGLKFGPDWMRNPPQQQEPIPQRQFALARNRYGREEMLQIFDQINTNTSDIAAPDELTQIPADFPEMVDSFQQPVAYMSPANERRVEMPRENAQPNTIGIGNGPRQQGAGRGTRQFPTTRTGTDWGQQRSRIGSSRSDLSDNWRGDRDAKPETNENDGWSKAGQRAQQDPNKSVWKRKGAQQQASRAPEWMFDSNDGAGGFDGSGNFTEDIPGPGHDQAAERYADDSDMRQSEERHMQSAVTTNSFDAHVESKKSPSPPEPEKREDDKAPILQARAQEAYQAPPSQAEPERRSGPPGIAPAEEVWIQANNIEWFYKDPNGNVQGPFPAVDMCEWHSLGYFKEELLVRRSIDQEFSTLGKTIARYGTDPFRATSVPGNKHPPALKPKEAPAPAQPAAPPQQAAPAPQAAAMAPQVPIAQPGLQPIIPSPYQMRDPIHEVICLIRSNPQYANTYRQLMFQIQSLEQYKNCTEQHEQLVLQHMAAMIRPQPQVVQPQPQPVAYVDPEAEKRRQLEEEQARKIEEERIRVENEKREAIKFENMLKAQEEELRKREEQLRLKEMTFMQQRDMLRFQEEERLKEEEAQRAAAEEEAKRKEEEELRQLEIKRQQQAEQQRLREIEEQERLEKERIAEEKRKMEQMHLFEQQKAQEQAKLLLERQNAEKARKEEAEKRRKKEEEKRQQEAKKAAAERKKLEAEQLAKRQEQIRREQERAAEKAAKKEAEKKERELKAAEEKARKAREDAKKWNAPATPVTSVPSFKDLQAKDEEEQKIQKKAKEIETAHKRAAEKVVVQSKGQSGWAGLVRGGSKNPPVPVSPVVAQKVTSKAGQQSSKKSAKNGIKTPKPKNEDLGFWDTAVTAVLTEPTAVNKVMSTPNKKNAAQQKADEANARSQFEKLTLVEDPLLSWARVELELIPNSNTVDVPTFVSFLREVEHDYEVEDYSRQFFGNGKEVLNFAHKFMEKRKQIRNEGTTKKSKGKKKNKNKATADLLGFTPAAGDQRNREGQLEGRF